MVLLNSELFHFTTRKLNDKTKALCGISIKQTNYTRFFKFISSEPRFIRFPHIYITIIIIIICNLKQRQWHSVMGTNLSAHLRKHAHSSQTQKHRNTFIIYPIQSKGCEDLSEQVICLFDQILFLNWTFTLNWKTSWDWVQLEHMESWNLN